MTLHHELLFARQFVVLWFNWLVEVVCGTWFVPHPRNAVGVAHT
jgi:hypothetical protein